MASNWEFADAWLLLAAADCGPTADLDQLIAAADLRNHVIPNPGELGRSVGRLIASDLATAHGLTVSLTSAGRRLSERARGGLFSQADHLLAILGRYPLLEGHWELPPGAYRAACDRYMSPHPPSDQSS